MADGTQIQALTTGSASYTYSLNDLSGAAVVSSAAPAKSSSAVNAYGGGDTVDISQEARDRATAQKDASASAETAGASIIPEGSIVDTVASATTKSGRQISVQRYSSAPASELYGYTKQNAGFGYTVSILDASGKTEQQFTLSQDTMVTEQEDGTLLVGSYKNGDETSGNDFIIGMNGKELSGGDGDDTIVELTADRASTRGDKTIAAGSISGGTGDDSVVLVGKSINANVDTGDGNDTITASGDLYTSNISTGAGDDKISVGGDLLVEGGTLTTGDGNDILEAKINLAAQKGATIDTGGGDDIISAGAIRANGNNSIVRTGDGNDTLNGNIGAIFQGTIDTGDGDDALNGNSWIGADYQGVINTGSGNDTLSSQVWLDATYGGRIDTGEGNDKLSSGAWITATYGGAIDTGLGDDSLESKGRIYSSSKGILNTGEGDDSIKSDTITLQNGGSINTGNGDDAIQTNSIGFSHNGEIDTGDGNDRISARIISGTGGGVLKTGEGNDSITAEVLAFVNIETGGGNDSISAKAILGSTIDTGSGSDAISYSLIDEYSKILNKGTLEATIIAESTGKAEKQDEDPYAAIINTYRNLITSQSADSKKMLSIMFNAYGIKR
ncbi:MAG: hypothetical protein FD177_2155 [Desulfovibrionaceae bacterium]|nr:MAG: hypothetical protein FD177_2155 [Desulfovibrionaceae bacterium]